MPASSPEPNRKAPAPQLPHLQTFAKAAELASFTRAADALSITQAAVSQHVRALERELGVPLFSRRGGRVELTQAGRTLYDFAQRILNLHQQARAATASVSEQLSEDLFIAASTIPAEHFLTGLIQDFRRHHPHVHVTAEVADSVKVVEALDQGNAVLGLVGRRVPTSWAEYHLFAKDRLVLVVSARHVWKKRKSITVQELRTQPLVLRGPGSGTRACLERALSMHDLTLADLNIAVELGSNEAIKDAVLRGLGAAILSIRAVTRELSARRLTEVAIENLDLTRELFVVTDRRRALPPAARAFLQFLESHPLAEQAS